MRRWKLKEWLSEVFPPRYPMPPMLLLEKRRWEYMVVEASSAIQLQHKVTAYLNAGWVLQGGIAAADGNWYQAMTYGGGFTTRTIPLKKKGST